MDDFALLSNPSFANRNILSIWNPFHGSEGLYYRPFQDSILIILYFLFKNNPFQYHVLSFIVFIFSSWLIYMLVKRLSNVYSLALLSAIFYIIHPINGILVNYITASIFSFQLSFLLGSILLLWEFYERKNGERFYILSLLCFLGTLLCHETSLIALGFISIVVLLFRKEPLKIKIKVLTPYFLILIAYFVFRLNVISLQNTVIQKMAQFQINGIEIAATSLQLAIWYISKLFFPQGIVLEWAIPVVRESVFLFLLKLSLWVIILGGIFYQCRQNKICLLALGWFCLGFLPIVFAAFVRPAHGAMVEPHWLIFSSVGFFIWIAHHCSVLLDRSKYVASTTLMVVLIAGWASSSYAYNRLWLDQKSYATYWLSQVPNLKIINLYLADAYEKEGDYSRARLSYQNLLLGNNSDMKIYNNLGIIAARIGDWALAESDYQKSLTMMPSAATYHNLGVLYQKQGLKDKAQKYFIQEQGMSQEHK